MTVASLRQLIEQVKVMADVHKTFLQNENWFVKSTSEGMFEQLRRHLLVLHRIEDGSLAKDRIAQDNDAWLNPDIPLQLDTEEK